MIKEACTESFTEALAARRAGADRVELCENLAVGGTTPSYGTIKYCVENLGIPAFVMIRPRGGNFVYNNVELEIMKTDIDICKKLKVPAVVFGLLTDKGSIDVKNTEELMRLARPMEVTFHKAFDELDDFLAGVDILADLGINRILTSGGQATAKEGAGMLNRIIEKSRGRITIVAAGKVTREALPALAKLIKTTEFHGKKIV